MGGPASNGADQWKQQRKITCKLGPVTGVSVPDQHAPPLPSAPAAGDTAATAAADNITRKLVRDEISIRHCRGTHD